MAVAGLATVRRLLYASTAYALTTSTVSRFHGGKKLADGARTPVVVPLLPSVRAVLHARALPWGCETGTPKRYSDAQRVKLRTDAERQGVIGACVPSATLPKRYYEGSGGKVILGEIGYGVAITWAHRWADYVHATCFKTAKDTD